MFVYMCYSNINVSYVHHLKFTRMLNFDNISVQGLGFVNPNDILGNFSVFKDFMMFMYNYYSIIILNYHDLYVFKRNNYVYIQFFSYASSYKLK